MPLQATSGAASYDAFGGGVPVVPAYIEEVFQTWLYTGNGSTQTITNGIDLSGKGGLVWIKQRDTSGNHLLMTTDGGPTKRLRSNGQPSYVTSAAGTDLASFNANGFSLGVNYQSDINTSAQTYVSWSLRKQPKFFDVVTWTGNGANRTIAHNLGSVPGCIIVGATTALGTDWAVYHSGLANTEYLTLNSTATKATSAAYWNSTTPTSTVFSLGTDAAVNYNGYPYIAYLFAHNAGGFGLTGTDNVISCGSYTGTGSPLSVTLGYEPQWILVKRATGGTNDWILMDTMRGMSLTQASWLYPNTSGVEDDAGAQCNPTATGFTITSSGTNLNAGGSNYIYIAIRRGPMKVPTDATKVFAPVTWTGNTTSMSGTRSVTGFGKPTDLFIGSERDNTDHHNYAYDRLRGTESGTGGLRLKTQSTNSEASNSPGYGTYSFSQMDGFTLGNYDLNYFTRLYVGWFFGRAPQFFDEVCYTGTGVRPLQLNHNLGAVPELMIVKNRTNAYDWFVYSAALGNTNYLRLNTTAAVATSSSAWSDTTPTSTTFTVGDFDNVNGSVNFKYVAYLFASCAGVSKVGSYTGTGALQTVNCGFTSGARFVLIKRTDSTGDWWTYDSARGITSGNDPYLFLNSTAAEVTGTNYVDTDSTGFKVTAAAPAGLNASGGSYIFLAVA